MLSPIESKCVNTASFEVFQANLDSLMRRFPKISFLALSVSCEWHFFTNSQDELNAKLEDEPIYSDNFIYRKTQKRLQSYSLEKKEVIYLYGIGLGYDYLALQPWLTSDPQKTLVVIEDDIERLYAFLHTTLAAKMIEDPQIYLAFVMPKEKKEKVIQDTCTLFPTKNIEVLAGFGISKRKYSKYLSYRRAIHQRALLSEAFFLERLYSHLPFQNFIQNSFELTHSFYANALEGMCKDMPVIICGAGPSLENEIPLLQKVGDKALIIAGGSAIAALSAHHIRPHIAIALDPNYEEFQRMVQNIAQEIVFLYATRVHPLVFSAFNGLCGYIRGAIGGLVEIWLDEQMHLQDAMIGKELTQDALSVTAIAAAIAKFLGCNPICFVGCDLSFHEGKRYAKGVESIPNSHKEKFQIFKKKDIHNKMVQTSTHWVLESKCIGKFFAKSSKDVFNASSEGIGFEGISNVAFSTFYQTYLHTQYDLHNYIFTHIQQANNPLLEKEELLGFIETLEKSMRTCLQLCKIIYEEYSRLETLHMTEPSGAIILAEIDLQEEVAYTYLFHDMNVSLDRYFGRIYREKDGAFLKKKKAKWFVDTINHYVQIVEKFVHTL